MERLDKILDKRRKVAEMYNKKLSNIEGVNIPYIHPDVARMSWFVYVIQVDKGIDGEKVMDYLKEDGVGCRLYFTPIHIQPYLKEIMGVEGEDYPITYDIGNSSIALPFYNNLKEEEIDYVVEKIKEAIAAQNI